VAVAVVYIQVQTIQVLAADQEAVAALTAVQRLAVLALLVKVMLAVLVLALNPVMLVFAAVAVEQVPQVLVVVIVLHNPVTVALVLCGLTDTTTPVVAVEEIGQQVLTLVMAVLAVAVAVDFKTVAARLALVEVLRLIVAQMVRLVRPTPEILLVAQAVLTQAAVVAVRVKVNISLIQEPAVLVVREAYQFAMLIVLRRRLPQLAHLL
jgi:hypothetical protein